MEVKEFVAQIAAQSCPTHRLAHAETVRGACDDRIEKTGLGRKLFLN